MNLVKNIYINQVEYLRNLGLSVKKHEITYYSDKSITYFIDIELNKKDIHIVITYNWFLNNGGIHIYYDKNLKECKLNEILDTEILNKEVNNFILKNIYKL